MKFREKVLLFCIEKPWWVVAAIALLTVLLSFQIPKIKIDTDPENMLSEEEFVRVFHDKVKKDFTLFDMIVLGVVNEDHPDGVFNPDTLKNVYRLTQKIERIDGVVVNDLLAPSRVDDIRQAGLGTIRFEWLMPSPPETATDAVFIRDRARENPMLNGTLISEDGKALCLYIPVRSKTLSYQVAEQIREFTRELKGNERYYITGLPVAEDTFGVEMFKQMAVSAPLAGVFIFLLMWFFFRNFVLVASAMAVAIITVLCTMGLLIGMGYPVHIMSSMIPIFLMPIAVVDSIHILSEFFDLYPKYKDRRKTIIHVMKQLFQPMLFTSLTSSAGFISLALTPNPPVKVFGIFVAFGIMLAWVVTITLIPAYIMLLGESSLKTLGMKKKSGNRPSLLESFLKPIGQWTYAKSRWIIASSFLIMGVSVIGITTIVINDNPVKWFEKGHEIRQADRVLNQHFGGTYMAYLVVEEKPDTTRFLKSIDEIETRLRKRIEELKEELPRLPETGSTIFSMLSDAKGNTEKPVASLLRQLADFSEQEIDKREGDWADAWEEINLFLEQEYSAAQTFKRPEVLRYLERLEETLMKTGAVGKINSVVDIIKKVHYELMEGNKNFNVIPETSAAVAQTLLSYQNSHDPDDLWHLVTADYQKANLWIQLKSGDNKDMEPALKAVREFSRDNPPPVPLSFQWAGLTYLNVVWQEKMVNGMLRSLSGSFVIVMIMSVFLFRSPLWGMLCMIPLTVTITFIYGVIGFVGKDYDMPVAVLSAMTLGLSVDFAIHFLQRSRATYPRAGHKWETTVGEMFNEPARAISRNILVIAVGFTPLLIAPLVPYQTVGLFLASIMMVSGIATLVILPALIKHMEPWLFKNSG